MKRVMVAYAHCCSGSTKYCDCTKPNHGKAVMGENEVGDDYVIIDQDVDAPTDWENLARRERLLRCKIEDERDLLRIALVRYGDKSRMGTVEPMKLQQAIDDALASGPSPAPTGEDLPYQCDACSSPGYGFDAPCHCSPSPAQKMEGRP